MSLAQRLRSIISMRTRIVVLGLFLLIAVSAIAEPRLETATTARNPLLVESQIQDVRVDGDSVIIRLYRQPYDFVAVKWLCVQTIDGRQMYARDLASRDNIRLEGDLDHNVVYASRITLQRRDEHLGGD
jgi:hypothetical protein